MWSLINKLTDKQIEILRNLNYRNSQNYLTTRFNTYNSTWYIWDAITLNKDYTHPLKNWFSRKIDEFFTKLIITIFSRFINNTDNWWNVIFYVKPNKYLVVKKSSLWKIKSQH